MKPKSSQVSLDYTSKLIDCLGLKGHPHAAWQAYRFTRNNPAHALHMSPICAHPTHRDIVVQETHPSLSQRHFDALSASFQPLLQEYRLIPNQHSSWILLSERPFEISTTPLTKMANQPMSEDMPRGPQQVMWQKVLTELQMCLHQHEVNQQRMEQGQLPINSVWFWGEGRMDLSAPCPYSLIVTDDENLHQYAKDKGIEVESIDATFRWQDYPSLLIALQRVDENRLKRLEALTDGASVTWYLNQAGYQTHPRRWWRRWLGL